jgi:uncharacterized protein YukJ
MPLSHGYGVLKGRVVDRQIEQEKSSPHFQVHIVADELEYRISINVRSVLYPYDLLYFLDDDFQHPIAAGLEQLSLGFTDLNSQSGGLALDYIRGNLFDIAQMKPLPFDVPGLDNDLNELIDLYIQRAIASEDAMVFAFGEPWGPESTPDKIFGFSPGRGIHDIHMNQGNSGRFAKENGVWQDGGLLIHFPSRNQWVAAFFTFQSQAQHTDDRTGNPLPSEPTPTPTPTPTPEPIPTPSPTPEPTPTMTQVKIVAALVNPAGDDVGKESVTLFNCSPAAIDLTGWAIADRLKRKKRIEDVLLNAGAAIAIPLSGTDAQLSNEGGMITLLDPEGVKVDGVAYTKEQVKLQGWSIVF